MARYRSSSNQTHTRTYAKTHIARPWTYLISIIGGGCIHLSLSQFAAQLAVQSSVYGNILMFEHVTIYYIISTNLHLSNQRIPPPSILGSHSILSSPHYDIARVRAWIDSLYLLGLFSILAIQLRDVVTSLSKCLRGTIPKAFKRKGSHFLMSIGTPSIHSRSTRSQLQLRIFPLCGFVFALRRSSMQFVISFTCPHTEASSANLGHKISL